MTNHTRLVAVMCLLWATTAGASVDHVCMVDPDFAGKVRFSTDVRLQFGPGDRTSEPAWWITDVDGVGQTTLIVEGGWNSGWLGASEEQLLLLAPVGWPSGLRSLDVSSRRIGRPTTLMQESYRHGVGEELLRQLDRSFRMTWSLPLWRGVWVSGPNAGSSIFHPSVHGAAHIMKDPRHWLFAAGLGLAIAGWWRRGLCVLIYMTGDVFGMVVSAGVTLSDVAVFMEVWGLLAVVLLWARSMSLSEKTGDMKVEGIAAGIGILHGLTGPEALVLLVAFYGGSPVATLLTILMLASSAGLALLAVTACVSRNCAPTPRMPRAVCAMLCVLILLEFGIAHRALEQLLFEAPSTCLPG